MIRVVVDRDFVDPLFLGYLYRYGSIHLTATYVIPSANAFDIMDFVSGLCFRMFGAWNAPDLLWTGQLMNVSASCSTSAVPYRESKVNRLPVTLIMVR